MCVCVCVMDMFSGGNDCNPTVSVCVREREIYRRPLLEDTSGPSQTAALLQISANSCAQTQLAYLKDMIYSGISMSIFCRKRLI